jgi:hypothetical protein
MDRRASKNYPYVKTPGPKPLLPKVIFWLALAGIILALHLLIHATCEYTPGRGKRNWSCPYLTPHYFRSVK